MATGASTSATAGSTVRIAFRAAWPGAAHDAAARPKATVMLERMAEYHVVYARREAGEWRAFVRGVRRCRSRGRTLRQARVALRRALAHVVADPYAIDFVEDVRLPGGTRRLIGGHWVARRKAEKAQKAADAATRRALQALLELSINVKDASDLLGIPPARLQKIARPPREGR
jgi:hypothetical protein